MSETCSTLMRGPRTASCRFHRFAVVDAAMERIHASRLSAVRCAAAEPGNSRGVIRSTPTHLSSEKAAACSWRGWPN